MKPIYQVYGNDAHAMTMQLMEAAHVADLIPSKNASIALKPNLVCATPPESGATTHAGVLSGVIEYLQNNGMMTPVPSINMALAIDTTDIGLIRSQCKTIVCDTSWKAIFAANDAEFEALWDDMVVQLEGFGWNDLVAFDTEKYQPIIDARNAAK